MTDGAEMTAAPHDDRAAFDRWWISRAERDLDQREFAFAVWSAARAPLLETDTRKTHEINVLVQENRALLADYAKLTELCTSQGIRLMEAEAEIERLSAPAEPVLWWDGKVSVWFKIDPNDELPPRVANWTPLYRYPAAPDDTRTLVKKEPLYAQLLPFGTVPYAHPAAPAPEPTRSQKLREAGYTRRPTWRSLPSDNMDDEPAPDKFDPMPTILPGKRPAMALQKEAEAEVMAWKGAHASAAEGIREQLRITRRLSESLAAAEEILRWVSSWHDDDDVIAKRIDAFLKP